MKIAGKLRLRELHLPFILTLTCCPGHSVAPIPELNPMSEQFGVLALV